MKKILSILFILMLIITFVQIRDMYALYKDELSGEYSTSLGKWNVKVNGSDIVSPGNVVDFNMTQGSVEYETGNYVFEGADVIAPGTEAFFDILIDTQGTEVAVKYEIEIGETKIDDATGDELVGQITSYRLIDHENGDQYIVDDTDDDEDDSPTDYEFEVPAPIRFEVLSTEDSFGNYSIDPGNGEIVGSESAIEFERKNDINDTKNVGFGVIPLLASQTSGITDKVTINFKWVSEESEEMKAMYKYLADLNEEGKKVQFIVPIKLKAIQYLGEDF